MNIIRHRFSLGAFVRTCLFRACALVLATTFVAVAFAASLIPCPDCGRDVSPRAVSCPYCGCPDDAIVQEAARLANLEKPHPVVAVVSETGRGTGLNVQMNGEKYVIMDVALLGCLESLKLSALADDQETVSYADFELADSVPLARFRVASDKLAYLPIAEDRKSKAKGYLLPDGSMASTPQPAIVGSINDADELLQISTQTHGMVSLNRTIKWKKILPSSYRAQTKLLQRLENSRRERQLSSNERAELDSVEWLTESLKEQAKKLEQKTEETP
jgi:hypothetical protein